MRPTPSKSRIARCGKFLLLLSRCCRPPLHESRSGRHQGLVLATLLLCAAAPARALEAPVLDSDSQVATAGYYQLSWRSDATLPEYELQESPDPAFSATRTLYQGPDTATVLTGRPEGDYHYRLRFRTDAGPSPWSAPVTVTVRHHSQGRALTFFSMGALVFVATVLAILIGNRRHPTRE